VLASATGPAELPRLTGGSVVPVDRLVDGEDVDLTGAVLVDHDGDPVDELGEARLVVGGNPVMSWRMCTLVPTATTVLTTGSAGKR
jgi:hypothetical protein